MSGGKQASSPSKENPITGVEFQESYIRRMRKVSEWSAKVVELAELEERCEILRREIKTLEIDPLVGNLKGQVGKASKRSESSLSGKEAEKESTGPPLAQVTPPTPAGPSGGKKPPGTKRKTDSPANKGKDTAEGTFGSGDSIGTSSKESKKRRSVPMEKMSD
jgi:hypothetical protein